VANVTSRQSGSEQAAPTRGATLGTLHPHPPTQLIGVLSLCQGVDKEAPET